MDNTISLCGERKISAVGCRFCSTIPLQRVRPSTAAVTTAAPSLESGGLKFQLENKAYRESLKNRRPSRLASMKLVDPHQPTVIPPSKKCAKHSPLT